MSKRESYLGGHSIFAIKKRINQKQRRDPLLNPKGDGF